MVKGMDLREEYKYQTTMMHMMTLQLWVNLMKEKQKSSKGEKKKAQQRTEATNPIALVEQTCIVDLTLTRWKTVLSLEK